MIKQGFAVMELGWEYNDEVYHHGEAGGGIPRGVYFDKAVAERKALEETGKAIIGTELCDYAYNPGELISSDRTKELAEILIDIFDLKNQDDDFVLEDWFGNKTRALVPKTVSLEKAMELARCLEIEWYTVVEVDVELE